jgi:hypothetical protein
MPLPIMTRFIFFIVAAPKVNDVVGVQAPCLQKVDRVRGRGNGAV